MKSNIVTPSVGESVSEVSILKWHKSAGDFVKSGDLLLEIESDKATVEVVAEQSGVLEILKAPGERLGIGALVGTIDPDAKPSTAGTSATASVSAPSNVPVSAKPAMPAGMPVPPPPPQSSASIQLDSNGAWATMGPAAKKTATEMGVDPNKVQGTGKDGRVTKGDVLQAGPASSAGVGGVGAVAGTSSAMFAGASAAGAVSSAGVSAKSNQQSPVVSTQVPNQTSNHPGERRVPMSMMRLKIAERLKSAQENAAILTTFNECDMTAVNAIRAQHKDAFKAKHGVPLSFMSFFSRACVEAMKVVPEVGAWIEGRDIVYHDYMDLGIAVGSERGLVVPVIRGAEKKGFVELEKSLAELAVKAKSGKLSIADMSGGTFTISNGGTYGSLMSTPILNPPQSAILGMHKIMERPMIVGGKVEARPMMYLALSYDHRLIDGKGAVTFLVVVKDMIENPEKLGFSY